MLTFVEGEDYYIEEGLMVLTARYHLRRGECCGNGCRHCPYQWSAVPEPQRSQLQRRGESEDASLTTKK